MSSITIYQSTTDLNDPELEQLISECQTIMTRGQNAVVDMCISIAEQQEHIKKTYKKKDRAAVQLTVINYVNVQATTYFKYARAGRHYIANPDSRHLSMDAVLKKPKRLAKPKKARSTYAHTINDEARQAELLKWEAFAHWLSAQMPADQFDKVYNRFCAQYRA